MEFFNAYAISPTFSSVTKTAFYTFATFYSDDGILEGAGSERGRSVIARTLLERAVYARLDRAPADIHAHLRKAQPNFFLPFDREGIDPFTHKFPVTLRLEGTVRGTGGLRVIDDSCTTTVAGLFAAGDAATRELICGGFTGGGSHNAAWGISSGTWAGHGAARYATARRGVARRADLRPIGEAGLRPAGTTDRALGAATVTRAVQAEVHPYDRNYFRRDESLRASIERLDGLWHRVRAGLHGSGPRGDRRAADASVRAREAAAMLAHARWLYASALERSETRGMHKRLDFPKLDPGQQQRRLVGGLDAIWTGLDPARPVSALEKAA
jgi:succinate dehydrogenase/fumarate reductase flavoprotein subunit